MADKAEKVKVTAEVVGTPGMKTKPKEDGPASTWAEIELLVDGARGKRTYRSFEGSIQALVKDGKLMPGKRYEFMVSEFRSSDDGPLYRNVHEMLGPVETKAPAPTESAPRGREAAFSADPVKLSSEEARSALHAAVAFANGEKEEPVTDDMVVDVAQKFLDFIRRNKTEAAVAPVQAPLVEKPPTESPVATQDGSGPVLCPVHANSEWGPLVDGGFGHYVTESEICRPERIYSPLVMSAAKAAGWATEDIHTFLSLESNSLPSESADFSPAHWVALKAHLESLPKVKK